MPARMACMPSPCARLPGLGAAGVVQGVNLNDVAFITNEQLIDRGCGSSQGPSWPDRKVVADLRRKAPAAADVGVGRIAAGGYAGASLSFMVPGCCCGIRLVKNSAIRPASARSARAERKCGPGSVRARLRSDDHSFGASSMRRSLVTRMIGCCPS
jgi:hypothetical protein